MISMPTTRTGQVSARDAAIYEAVCRRDRSLAAIGAEYGLTAQRIHQIAKRMDGLLFQELQQAVGEIKSRQTATLRHIAQEAMTAWLRSQGEQEVVHERTTKDGVYREVTKTVSSGNPAYLTAALRAMEDIRRIWGADAPKQLHVDTHNDDLPPAEKLQRIGEKMKQLIPAVAMKALEEEPGRSGLDGSFLRSYAGISTRFSSW